MKILIAFVLLLTACSHRMTAPVASAERRAPYPLGKYQHDVRVQIHGPSPRDLSLSGALNYSATKIVLVGLSPMGPTLFRLTDDLKTGDLQIEYFVESLNKADPQIRAFYRDLREALLSRDPQTKFAKNGTDFVFADLDANGVPRTFYLANPHFEVTVNVVSYEP